MVEPRSVGLDGYATNPEIISNVLTASSAEQLSESQVPRRIFFGTYTSWFPDKRQNTKLKTERRQKPVPGPS